ncbi:hypothetical protein [Saliphagus sp. LR7]|uniref:hypothetical protein n=1 Tax=Saliphagus sp. LR7 TaxID=2282654 RepID=UPI001E5BB823|nr:hypothetical protein [Saliphagus sp. LR7]
MNTHHIVSGKYLPKEDARIDLNLVTLCSTCHGRLEGAHIERQLAETGRDDALGIVEFLKGRRRNVHGIARELDLPEERVESLVDHLERMCCIGHIQGRVYRAICPATAHATAVKYERHREQGADRAP